MTRFLPSEWESLRDEIDGLHWSLRGDKATGLAAQELLVTAEDELRIELEEELKAGEYDDKPLLWRGLVHERAVHLAIEQQDILDGAAVKVLQTINREALFHHTGHESVEEMFRNSGKGTSMGKISNLNGLAATVEWVKANNVPCLEPIDNAARKWKKIDPEQWFRGKNKDDGSRTHRLIKILPELRRITGQIKKYDYAPLFEAEIRPEIEADDTIPWDRKENEIERQVRNELVTVMANALKQVADHGKTTTEVQEYFNGVRNAKPVIPVTSPNGDG
ncbi:hypothetical protein ACFLXQ_09050, partial [Chloroflexota bacterium]